MKSSNVVMWAGAVALGLYALFMLILIWQSLVPTGWGAAQVETTFVGIGVVVSTAALAFLIKGLQNDQKQINLLRSNTEAVFVESTVTVNVGEVSGLIGPRFTYSVALKNSGGLAFRPWITMDQASPVHPLAGPSAAAHRKIFRRVEPGQMDLPELLFFGKEVPEQEGKGRLSSHTKKLRIHYVNYLGERKFQSYRLEADFFFVHPGDVVPLFPDHEMTNEAEE